jgi:hypothetical protein
MNGPTPQNNADEAAFREWYANWADKLRMNPNPDDPRHYYDYRSAYRAGVEPQPYVASSTPGSTWGSGQMMPDRAMERAPMHWTSEFKREGHPNEIVNGVNTRTGEGVKQNDLEVLRTIQQQMSGGQPGPYPSLEELMNAAKARRLQQER